MPAIWNGMRTFLSTMKNNSNIGRNLNFLIRDKKTEKLLGVTCMSSDFLDLHLEMNILVGTESQDAKND